MLAYIQAPNMYFDITAYIHAKGMYYCVSRSCTWVMRSWSTYPAHPLPDMSATRIVWYPIRTPRPQ